MYVAVKGGEAAIANAHSLLADRRRGDRSVPALRLDQIVEQLALGVDRVMSEGSLYDRELAALAIVQARGDMMQDCAVWCATIRKFSNIAASVRINATNHPTWRATLHHFTYRAADYWPDADMETDFFEWRRSNRVVIGHDFCRYQRPSARRPAKRK